MDTSKLRKRGNYNDSMAQLKQPKVYRDKLQEAIKDRLNYFENVQKKLDAHQTKASSILIRKKWLEKQKINNYTNEYDRIRGLIAQNVVKHGPQTVEHLKKRASKLEELGAIAVDKIDY
jgi:hypothetical protein